MPIEFIIIGILFAALWITWFLVGHGEDIYDSITGHYKQYLNDIKVVVKKNALETATLQATFPDGEAYSWIERDTWTIYSEMKIYLANERKIKKACKKLRRRAAKVWLHKVEAEAIELKKNTIVETYEC